MSEFIGPYRVGPNDDENCGIYTGDALDLMQAIPDDSIDIVFTSPPYNVGLDYNMYEDNLPEEKFWKFQEHWLRETARVSCDGARLYATVGDKMMWQFRDTGNATGWKFHQVLVWCKPNLASVARISGDWNRMAEFCLLFHKGKKTPMLEAWSDWNVTTHNFIVASTPQSNFTGNKKKRHVAQMALDVAIAWLARTPGEVVLDPFLGSGTTAIAAKMLGKQYLGFEIDPATAETSREWAQNVQMPLPSLVYEQTELSL